MQDEFICVLQGQPTQHTDAGRTPLWPGMCAGFKAGTGNPHRLSNETAQDAVFLEVGDRSAGDSGTCPDDDLQASLLDGVWQFTHKDGRPHPRRRAALARLKQTKQDGPRDEVVLQRRLHRVNPGVR